MRPSTAFMIAALAAFALTPGLAVADDEDYNAGRQYNHDAGGASPPEGSSDSFYNGYHDQQDEDNRRDMQQQREQESGQEAEPTSKGGYNGAGDGD